MDDIYNESLSTRDINMERLLKEQPTKSIEEYKKDYGEERIITNGYFRMYKLSKGFKKNRYKSRMMESVFSLTKITYMMTKKSYIDKDKNGLELSKSYRYSIFKFISQFNFDSDIKILRSITWMLSVMIDDNETYYLDKDKYGYYSIMVNSNVDKDHADLDPYGEEDWIESE